MRKLRILVVDDDHDFATGLADIMEVKGHDVETANSGEDALRSLDVFQFNLVFMDVSMPGLSGLDALPEIMSRKPDLKVVIVTGHRGGDLGERASSLGAYGFLHKPFRPEEALGIIERISNG